MPITIDKDYSLPIYSDICMHCKQWIVAPGKKCAAFPDGIPDAIWLSENDHKQPYPGDHGIQFEALNRIP